MGRSDRQKRPVAVSFKRNDAKLPRTGDGTTPRV